MWFDKRTIHQHFERMQASSKEAQKKKLQSKLGLFTVQLFPVSLATKLRQETSKQNKTKSAEKKKHGVEYIQKSTFRRSAQPRKSRTNCFF